MPGTAADCCGKPKTCAHHEPGSTNTTADVALSHQHPLVCASQETIAKCIPGCSSLVEIQTVQQNTAFACQCAGTMADHRVCCVQTGASTSPLARGPFQKFSSRKTRSGELPRRHSTSSGLKEAAAPISPQESGGSMPQPQPTPFGHSNTWGPRTGPPAGAVACALESASSGPLGSRAAPPSTPPQQPGGETHGLQQVFMPP